MTGAERVISQAEMDSQQWVAINGVVYDLTKFSALHPGGQVPLRTVYGKDATKEFYSLHRQEVLDKYGPKLRIGVLEGAKERHVPGPAEISQVPFSESPFWLGLPCPHTTEVHDRFRRDLRKFLQEEIAPFAEQYEKTGKSVPDSIMQKLGEKGVLASRIGVGDWVKVPPRLPGDIKPEEFDVWCEKIAHEEVSRLTCPGFTDAIGSGMVIGLPPVAQSLQDEALKKQVVEDVLMGRKRICLAITEPGMGSDVANILTTARLSPDKTHYIVTGQKKWITGGYDSHWFTTLVRTGGPGMKGLSMLLIPRGPGVTTKKIATAYSSTAGTCLIEFDNVQVPVTNLVGGENQGFLTTMVNFNHERWFICLYIATTTRLIISETLKWVHQRDAFGKKLIDNAVVRNKIATAVAACESNYAWIDQITYQISQQGMESPMLIAGVSLLKYQTTRTAGLVADIVVNLFGGRGITQEGMGRLIERFHRTYKFAAILGGSEEIMADLGVRQISAAFPKNHKL